ncbi:MAG: 7-carboxy-7-deazaguanine synthase QueE [Candidatus Altiarchaeota archaeon]|nr:7-carboxy-7-deazaguanine synthase QueE [Candidatus Altiarchaeota archaeon]
MYKVNEVYASIQGEGILLGTPMNFIRFCRCNLSCSWCDTDFEEGVEMDVEEILKELDEKVGWVSLTGGEPMLEEDLVYLIKRLREENFKILLETNGTLFNEEVFMLCDFLSMDLKGPSSGNEGFSEEAFAYCLSNPVKSQLKVVIQDDDDLIFFNRVYSEEYNNWVLQPEWKSMKELDYKRIMEEFPRVRVIPQIHRLMGVR